MMLEQQLAAEAMQRPCMQPGGAGQERGSGRPAPTHRQRCSLQAAAGRAAQRKTASGAGQAQAAAAYVLHPRRSITHSAWPQSIGFQRQRQRPQHLLWCPPCSVAAAMANLLAASCASTAGRRVYRSIDLHRAQHNSPS
jgi:hypothetical protein